MRNLYSRLGIKQSSTRQEIRDAIENCTSSVLKADASEVLLVETRRRHYDQLHDVLSDIGALRANLGLNHGDHWKSPEADDYSRTPSAKTPLYDVLVNKIQSLKSQKKRSSVGKGLESFFSYTLKLGAFLAVFIGLFWVIDNIEESPPSGKTSSSAPSAPSAPLREIIFAEPELALPNSGHIRRHVSSEPLAPLQINTDSGSNYFIKLENVSTGTVVLDVFVRGGATAEIDVPLGNYVIKYATGEKWYGYQYLFGPNTAYSKTDTNFRFYEDGLRVRGYTLTLYKVANGNLSTSRLSPDQF